MGELQLERRGLDQARRRAWQNLPFSTAGLGKSFTPYSKGNDRRLATRATALLIARSGANRLSHIDLLKGEVLVAPDAPFAALCGRRYMPSSVSAYRWSVEPKVLFICWLMSSPAAAHAG